MRTRMDMKLISVSTEQTSLNRLTVIGGKFSNHLDPADLCHRDTIYTKGKSNYIIVNKTQYTAKWKI